MLPRLRLEEWSGVGFTWMSGQIRFEIVCLPVVIAPRSEVQASGHKHVIKHQVSSHIWHIQHFIIFFYLLSKISV